jgi:hypothetical protein
MLKREDDMADGYAFSPSSSNNKSSSICVARRRKTNTKGGRENPSIYLSNHPTSPIDLHYLAVRNPLLPLPSADEEC